jgi:hypothetical protein
VTHRTLALIAVIGLVHTATPAHAQNWSFDARRIALGGIGTNQNLASESIQDEREYRAIVLPLGLLQVLRNRDVFNPDSDRFDLVRSIEYAASPMHYMIDRDGTGTGSRFVTDLRNGRLSRDLNDYRGFAPVSQPVVNGLAAPRFGATIPVYRGTGTSHGVYVGAGPYLAMRGSLAIDEQLMDIFSSTVPMYLPDTQLQLQSGLRAQMALAVTGGYRGRMAAFGTHGDRDGLYVAANYNILRGFRYEDADFDVRFDTDHEGLVTSSPSSPVPLLVTRDTATSGSGFSMDVGVGAVFDRWELGFGANGIANRIDWRSLQRITYSLDDLMMQSGFSESAPLAVGDARVTLPVEYVGNVGYRMNRWMIVAEAGRGLQGMTAHGGVEYRLGLIEPRVGAFYSRERWQPSAGVGLTLAPRVALDVAMYATDANVERKRRAAFATSLRIGGGR